MSVDRASLLAAVGVQADSREPGIVALRYAEAGVRADGLGLEWLRQVFVAFGLRARMEGDDLLVSEGEALARVVAAALLPAAVLFDLDGVLADIAARRCIADPADVAAIASAYPIAVVTTCPRRLAVSVLERHGFAEHVQEVVGSDDGPCKPDPFPVRLALERLGVTTAWMLGDNPSDVLAARGGGAVPFAVRPRGYGGDGHADRLRGAGALRLVEGVAELRRLLPS